MTGMKLGGGYIHPIIIIITWFQSAVGGKLGLLYIYAQIYSIKPSSVTWMKERREKKKE